MTAADAWTWMRRAPAERMTLPAAGVVWTAAEILHAEHFSAIYIGMSAAAAAGLTYGAIARHGGDAARHARQALTALAALGGWMTAAVQLGPTAGRYCALSIAYTAGSLGGYLWLRRHEVVRAAREWRIARADWHGRASRYGLNQTHLLEYERNWLGEEMLVDVTDTGRRASSFVRGGDLAEQIAEAEMLAESRVQVTGGGIAGRIRISIRYADPWRSPLPHPVLEPVDGFDMPVPASVRQPLIVGYNPDNGDPIHITLWDKTGAKNVYIVGMHGAGKSALLSCLRERITACDDALLWDLNVSKAAEDDDWTPACDLTAIGPDERQKALEILTLAEHAITWRSAQPRRTREFQPTAAHPLIVIMADEIDVLAQGNDWIAAAIKTKLTRVATKGRSEAVALVSAGQRGTAVWMGGADIRAQYDVFAVGKVNRQSEVNNAIGATLAASIPDMSRYGEGEPGVWAIIHLGKPAATGRSFKLDDPADLRWLADTRAGSRPGPEAGLVAHLGEAYTSLKPDHEPAHGPASRPGWATPGASDGGPSPWAGGEPARAATAVLDPEPTSLENLGRAVTEALPPDLVQQMSRMDARSADTRRITAESEEIRRSLPDVDPAAVAAAAAERWRRGAEDTGPLPPEIQDQLIGMLTDGGASGRSIARAFEPDIKRWTVQIWLNRLRHERIADVYGEGRGRRWMLRTEAEALGLTPASGPTPGEEPSS